MVLFEVTIHGSWSAGWSEALGEALILDWALRMVIISLSHDISLK